MDDPAAIRQPRGPVGVLAIQGSFDLHQNCLERLGVSSRLIRKPGDLEGLSALVIPGGESTVMSLLLEKYDLFEPLVGLGREGFPMFGTCAGAILLGHGEGRPRRLEVCPVALARNAYGTQVDSFTATLSLKPFQEPFHGVFIRAPQILGSTGQAEEISVLGEHGGSPILVAAGSVLLATFHPELTQDLRVHRYFLQEFVLRREA